MSIDSKFIFSIMLMSFCHPGPHYYIVVQGILLFWGHYPSFLFALCGGPRRILSSVPEPYLRVQFCRLLTQLELQNAVAGNVSDGLTGVDLLSLMYVDVSEVGVDGDVSTMAHHHHRGSTETENGADLTAEYRAYTGSSACLDVYSAVAELHVAGRFDAVLAVVVHYPAAHRHRQTASVACETACQSPVGGAHRTCGGIVGVVLAGRILSPFLLDGNASVQPLFVVPQPHGQPAGLAALVLPLLLRPPQPSGVPLPAASRPPPGAVLSQQR